MSRSPCLAFEDATCPQREGERLGEAGGAHDPELEQVVDVTDLARMGDPERVGIAVEVEARNRGEAHPGVHDRPRLAGEDLDAVTELYELAGDVSRVDALTAATRIAAVDEKRDPEAVRAGRSSRLSAPVAGCEGSVPKTAAGRSSVASGTYATGVLGGRASNMTAQPPPLNPSDANEPWPASRPPSGLSGTTFVSDGPDIPARGRGISC